MSKKRETAELVAPDPFVEGANKAADWMQTNLKLVLGAAVALVLAAVGYLVISSQNERGASAVTSSLSEAIRQYKKSTDPEHVMTTTVASELNEGYAKSLQGFEEVIQSHGDTEAGRLAKLYAGDLEFRMGNFDKSGAHYKAYADSAQEGDLLLHIALEGAGYCAEEQGKLDEALGYFERLTKLPDGFYQDFALKHKARVLEAKGDKDKAIEAYKSIVEDHKDSSLHDFAEARLRALE